MKKVTNVNFITQAAINALSVNWKQAGTYQQMYGFEVTELNIYKLQQV